MAASRHCLRGAVLSARSPWLPPLTIFGIQGDAGFEVVLPKIVRDGTPGHRARALLIPCSDADSDAGLRHPDHDIEALRGQALGVNVQLHGQIAEPLRRLGGLRNDLEILEARRAENVLQGAACEEPVVG